MISIVDNFVLRPTSSFLACRRAALADFFAPSVSRCTESLGPFAIATWLAVAGVLGGCGATTEESFSYVNVHGEHVPEYSPAWLSSLCESIQIYSSDSDLEPLRLLCQDMRLSAEAFLVFEDEFFGSADSMYWRGEQNTYYFTRAGGLFLKIPYPLTGPFSDGLALVYAGDIPTLAANPEQILCGFVDRAGEFVIPPTYTSCYPFSDGLALVSQGGAYGYGYIDTTGKVVIPFQFLNSSEPCSEGLCNVAHNEGSLSLNLNGEVVLRFKRGTFAGAFHDGLAPVFIAYSAHYEYIDTSGNSVIVLGGEYSDVREFSEGRAAVCKNDRWGFIDRNGHLVVPTRYKWVSKFHDGIAAVYE